jgi:uncharacterized protein (DUF342 family)
VGSEENPNGKIIGGELNLVKSLKAGVIGAPADSYSRVTLNQLFDKVVAKRDELRETIDDKKNVLESIKTAVEHLKALPDSDDKKTLMSESVISFEKQKKIYKLLIVKAKALESKQRELFDGCRVEVKERIYSGIEFEIGNERTRTKREHGPSKVLLLEGKLRIDPL